MPRVKPRLAPQPLPDRPGRWKLLWRRQRRLLRPTAIASIIVTTLIVGSIGINMLGHGAPLGERIGRATSGMGLDVQHIIVDGRQKTPEALVRTALGVSSGDPILSFSVTQARVRLESLTWVRNAVVERQLPDTIHVVLTERAPFAVWQNQGKFALIDRAGNVVTDSEIAAFADKLPLVVGVGAPTAAASLLDSLAAVPDLIPRVVAAIRVGERRWDLCMTSGATVQLPEGAEPQALGKLAELQTAKALLDRPLQEIDLRLPDRLRLRPMTDGPCGQRADQSRTVIAQPRRAT
jgi:cell division protein FtsQ